MRLCVTSPLMVVFVHLWPPVEQYQIFFVLFSGLLIRVNVTSDNRASQRSFGIVLVAINFVGPVLAIGMQVTAGKSCLLA
jgi:hypothetical protein